MISLNDIKNGSQFVVTPAGAADVIHQLPSFTPVVRDSATYPNNDHAFYPNGILPDGADRPVPVAQGVELASGMVITVDQLVYHCARTASDQKAYQCVHGTVIDPGNSDFEATGYFYLTYADITRVEPYTAPAKPLGPTVPGGINLTIIAGSTTYALAVVKDDRIAELKPGVGKGGQTPKTRIHVVQQTLYQGAGTSTPDARVSIRTPGGIELASRTTDANGLAEFPEDLCIQPNIIQTESPAGFSSGRSAAEREISLGLPDPYRQKTAALQLPVDAIFFQGAGSGDARSSNDVLAIIRDANQNQSFSIGSEGRLLLKFEPPLIHRAGQPILKIAEASAGSPGEGYQIVLGNQLDPTSTHVQQFARISVHPNTTDRRYDIYLPSTIADGTTFGWIEIADIDEGGGVAGQPANQLGVDLTSILGYVIEQSIAVLLDVSGSMSVNDEWERSTKNESLREATQQGSPPDQRLYWNAFQSILGSLLPTGSAELPTATFRMYAFFGQAADITLLCGPAGLSAFRATVLPDKIRNTYNQYTPLASALQRGFDDLRNDQARCRIMIVITDGEGSAGEELLTAVQRIGHDNWTGVIELIGYKVFPLTDIYQLLRFEAQGWSVAPHLVSNKGELDALLKRLRTKYALQ